jgi:cell shape-determining protein MreC
MRWHWPSKTAAFWILMGVSALGALVPREWTAPARGFFQPLALLQWPLSWFTGKAREAAGGAVERALPASQARELEAELGRLQRQVLNQRLALDAAERRVEELSGLAGQMPDSHAGIIVAPVVSSDADPRHGTLLIARGEQKVWVREGEWVVAGGAGAPAWDAGAEVHDLLWRGWLIGRVSEVHPHVARVELATDPRFATEVRTARMLADGSVQLAADGCHLRGQGPDHMRITQAVEDYYKTGHRIVVVPAQRDLPVSMTLGRITDCTPRDDSSQHFDLDVVPWGPIEQLTHVYVIVTEP